MCVDILPASVSVYCGRVVPMRPKEGAGSPWDWGYRWLLAAVWVMGIEPGSSGRLANAFDH